MNGHCIYQIEIKPFTFLSIPSVSFSPLKYPNIATVDVKSLNNRQVEVKVTFAGVASEQDASVIGMDLASVIADRLAFSYGVNVAGPQEVSMHFGKSISSAIGCCTFGGQTIVIDPLQSNSFSTMLSADEPNRGPYKLALRHILQCDDPVGKFLLLYAMLYELQGNSTSQADLDKWLNATFNVVLPYTNPKTGKAMSDISKLRNDIAHPPKGVSLHTTRQQMETQMSDVLRFVQAAIQLVPA